MIYISGAITGTDDYRERFDAAERELTKEGYIVVNPARVSAQMPKLSYDDYMRMAITMLDLCTDIYMLDGWKNSRGAQCEHAYAEAMGIVIRYQTPKQEEKKYYWRLNGAFGSSIKYLNWSAFCEEVMIQSAEESNNYKARFTETEYKALAEKFHFPECMFIKEEIE